MCQVEIMCWSGHGIMASVKSYPQHILTPCFWPPQHFINRSHTQWPKMKAPQFFSWFIWSQTYCYLQLESHLITSIWKKAFWRFERRRVACTKAEISKYRPNIKVDILWEGYKNERNHPGDLTLTKLKINLWDFVKFSWPSQKHELYEVFLLSK